MNIRFRRALGIGAWLSFALALAAAGSGCNSSSGVGLASTCSINSDCNSPLICAFTKCHSACHESRDCTSGERCVQSGASSICQLPAESTCGGSGTTCQTGQVCGSDQQCRTQCSPTVACTMGDFCVPSGTTSACYAPAIVSDQPVLMAAGITGADGGVIGDGSAGSGDANSNGSDGEGGGGTGDATMGTSDGAQGSSDGNGNTSDGSASTTDATGGKSDASDGGSTVVPNSCPSAQTQFGNTAQGDSNPNFTSGVGVRTATSLLIFSGYAGPDPDGGAPSDAADAGTANLVYVQAFDPTTANSLGPAHELFAAPSGPGFALASAAIAPTGQIALAFNYGGGYSYINGVSTQGSVYAAFLGASADAGPAGVTLQRPPLQIESAQITGQPHVTWSVATGAFVFSWEYFNVAWFLGTKSLRPNGQAAGGTNPVPTDQTSAAVFNSAYQQEQGSVAAGPNLLGVAFKSTASNYPFFTILDPSGNQVGSSLQIVQRAGAWVTVGATAQGFVYLYDNGSSVGEAFVPTSGDAGPIVPDAGLGGFTFTGAIGAYEAHAINDDTGGLGGVGVALLYANGLSFAYVNADGVAHVGPLSVIPHTYAGYDQINITNFGGSFGLSLYSAASQSTQMAASGCQ